jgi:hypothetical protein
LALTGQEILPSSFASLADEAARIAKLSETAQRITVALLREVNAEEQGLHAYFNFRSLSEISKLNEPAWA